MEQQENLLRGDQIFSRDVWSGAPVLHTTTSVLVPEYNIQFVEAVEAASDSVTAHTRLYYHGYLGSTSKEETFKPDMTQKSV